MPVNKFSDYIGDVEVSSLWFYHVELPSRHVGVIEEVWTHPDYRNQGRATRLIKQALYHATDIGCDCIELTVRQDNKDVQEFYKSLGFEDRLNYSYRKKL
jgi:ribosomal protein S18 acetylase RimI-like enzyme